MWRGERYGEDAQVENPAQIDGSIRGRGPDSVQRDVNVVPAGIKDKSSCKTILISAPGLNMLLVVNTDRYCKVIFRLIVNTYMQGLIAAPV